MKPFIIKSIGKIFILCLWLVVGFLLAEFSVRIYEYIVCRTNPLILSLNNQPPWSHSEPVQNRHFQSVIELPPLDITQWYALRAEFFLQLDEHDRQLFSSFHQIAILIKYADKNEKSIYLPEPDVKNYFNEEFLTVLEKEVPIAGKNHISKYYPSFIMGNKTIRNLFVYRSTDKENRGFLVCWYKGDNKNSSQSIKDESDIWEIPYFEYKKHAQLDSYEFHTNNFGFRDRDVVVPKPADVFRIVCIGGSTTEEGPTEQETYPNILEKLLQEQNKGPYKIEVINAGIPGISANKLWLRLSDYLMMEPNLIVYCEGANDITHILLPYWLNHLNGIKKTLLQSKLLRKVSPLFFLPDNVQIRNDINKDIITQVEKIRNYLQEKDIALVVMSMPAPNYSKMSRQEKDYFQYVTRKWWGGEFINYKMYSHTLEIYNNLLKEKFNDGNTSYIPLYEMFQNEPPSYFNDLCHQKLKGIQKKAELATPYLLGYIKQSLSGNRE